MPARFVDFAAVRERLEGRSVAVVGSGPGVLENRPGFVDSHEVVIRVNNHRCGEAAGQRTDVHYSFYGSSIRKSPRELRAEGVRLVMCKCPNSQPLVSEWHERKGQMCGVNFRYIYANRKLWWFCDTFVPDDARFMAKVALLKGHVPTTGFAAILDVIDCAPASIFLTGFDFFQSGIHNVDQKWRPGDPRDPIGHRPDTEAALLAARLAAHNITCDPTLTKIMRRFRA